MCKKGLTDAWDHDGSISCYTRNRHNGETAVMNQPFKLDGSRQFQVSILADTSRKIKTKPSCWNHSRTVQVLRGQSVSDISFVSYVQDVCHVWQWSWSWSPYNRKRWDDKQVLVVVKTGSRSRPVFRPERHFGSLKSHMSEEDLNDSLCIVCKTYLNKGKHVEKDYYEIVSLRSFVSNLSSWFLPK